MFIVTFETWSYNKCILETDSSFFSFAEFLKTFKVKTNYNLEYFKDISALRQYKKFCLPIDDSVGSKDTLDSRLPNTSTCRKVY